MIPQGVEFSLSGSDVRVKGKHGVLDYTLHPAVHAVVNGNEIMVSPSNKHHPMVGTTCRLLSNMIHGVSKRFKRKLRLVGVGYRAKVQGSKLELNLGYSNPVIYDIPEGVTIETPSNTEIVLTSIRNDLVGQTAAEIRAKRPPEPYKGKGVRLDDSGDEDDGKGGRGGETVIMKQAKKKK